MSFCSISGQHFSVGDAQKRFCVQSCSKPIAYCLALEEHGEEKVHQECPRYRLEDFTYALSVRWRGTIGTQFQ